MPTPQDAARRKCRQEIKVSGGVDPFNEPAYERNRERLAQNERKWRDSLEIKKQNGSGADNPCDQPVRRCCHPGVSNGASAMDDRPPAPTALLTIAALFFLYGTATLPGTFLSIAAGSPHIDMGVLGIPTFFGLRRFSRGWRTFALVLIWLAFIGCLAGVGFGFAQDKYSTVHVFGIVLKEVEPIWVSAASVPVFLIALWGYRVLTRPTIRALFYEGPRERSSATV